MSQACIDFQRAGLGAMAEALKTWSAEDNSERTHEELAQFLIDAHLNATVFQREERLLRQAQLPRTGRICDVLPWMRQRGIEARRLNTLAKCAWVVANQLQGTSQVQHVIVTGEHGSGKTALVAALAREAIAKLHTVRYHRLPELLTELSFERGELALRKALGPLVRPDVLVLDDVTEEPINEVCCRLLRQVVDARHRVGKPIVLAASAAIEDWDGFLLDPTSRSSVYSRLLHRPIHLDIITPAAHCAG